jgi:hypothetical protein
LQVEIDPAMRLRAHDNYRRALLQGALFAAEGIDWVAEVELNHWDRAGGYGVHHRGTGNTHSTQGVEADELLQPEGGPEESIHGLSFPGSPCREASRETYRLLWQTFGLIGRFS